MLSHSYQKICFVGEEYSCSFPHHTHMHACRHVTPIDKPGKRYRNVHADVFVIADDEENGMLGHIHNY